MKAVITVTGRDNIGIIARVSTECSNYGGNIPQGVVLIIILASL